MIFPRPHASRGASRRALAGAAVAVALLFSCLAPVRAPQKTAEAETPYESIAASVALGNPQDALAQYEAAVITGKE